MPALTDEFNLVDIRFRPATPADGEFAYGLFRRAIEPVIVAQLGAWPEDRQRHFFFTVGAYPSGHAQIVLYKGQPVGTAEFNDAGDYIWIKGLYLEEAVRGRGVGSLVIDRALALAHAARKPLQLETLKANAAAQAAFVKKGFVLQGENKYEKIFRHRDTLAYQPAGKPRGPVA